MDSNRNRRVFIVWALLLVSSGISFSEEAKPAIAGPAVRLDLPGEDFTIKGHKAFLLLPEESKRLRPQPWVFYAPTLPGLPDEAEKWMHQHFLEAGVAVAGVD